jgi:hypothetical protein
MGEKKGKWQDHLKAAEGSGLKLSAYAAQHEIDVRRLYEARRVRGRRSKSAWTKVRVKPEAALQASSKAGHNAMASVIAMQARLGNGVVVSWTHDQRNADTPASVLRSLAQLPCFI